MLTLGVTVSAAAAAVAALVGVLLGHIRRGRRPPAPRGQPYRPHSADLRGRWRVTRHDPAVLPDCPPLPTDHDPGHRRHHP